MERGSWVRRCFDGVQDLHWSPVYSSESIEKHPLAEAETGEDLYLLLERPADPYPSEMCNILRTHYKYTGQIPAFDQGRLWDDCCLTDTLIKLETAEHARPQPCRC